MGGRYAKRDGTVKAKYADIRLQILKKRFPVPVKATAAKLSSSSRGQKRLSSAGEVPSLAQNSATVMGTGLCERGRFCT